MADLKTKIKIGDVYLKFMKHSGSTRYEAVIDSDDKEVLKVLDSDSNRIIMDNMTNDKIKIIRDNYKDGDLKSISIYTDYPDYNQDINILAGAIAGLQFNNN